MASEKLIPQITADVRLREPASGDESTVLRMMRVLAELPPAIPFDDEEIRATLRLFLARPAFGRFWLIEHAGQVAGYLILTIGFSFEFRGHDAFIDELYIEPEFRRRGLARTALHLAESRARNLGVTAVHLEVDPDNAPGLELYRRAGYIDQDRRLMTKWLVRRP